MKNFLRKQNRIKLTTKKECLRDKMEILKVRIMVRILKVRIMVRILKVRIMVRILKVRIMVRILKVRIMLKILKVRVKVKILKVRSQLEILKLKILQFILWRLIPIYYKQQRKLSPLQDSFNQGKESNYKLLRNSQLTKKMRNS